MAAPKKTKPEGYVFGRPTKYKKEYCNEVIKIAKECDPYEFTGIVAVGLKVSRDTLQEWRRTRQDFSAAYEMALEIWGMRMAKFFIETKSDYRYYRTLNWQVRRVICEPAAPSQEITHLIEPIPNLIDVTETNREALSQKENGLICVSEKS